MSETKETTFIDSIESFSRCLLTRLQDEQPCAGLVLTIEAPSRFDPNQQYVRGTNNEILELDDEVYDLDQLENPDLNLKSSPEYSGCGNIEYDCDIQSKATTGDSQTTPKLCRVDVGYCFDNRLNKKQVNRTKTPLKPKNGKSKIVECGKSKFQVSGEATVFYDRRMKTYGDSSSKQTKSHNKTSVSGGTGGGLLDLVTKLRGIFFRKRSSSQNHEDFFEVVDVRVAIIEIADPADQFKNEKFKKALDKLVKQILQDNKLPAGCTTTSIADKYGHFFDDWGTHLIIQQELGIIEVIEHNSTDNTDSKIRSTGVAAKVGEVSAGELKTSVDVSSNKRGTDLASKRFMLVNGNNRIFNNREDVVKCAEEHPSALENSIQLFPHYQFLKAGSIERNHLEKVTEELCRPQQEQEEEVEAHVPSKKRKRI